MPAVPSPRRVPPFEPRPTSLVLSDRKIDLSTRALVVAVVPTPRWAREAEVLAGVHGAADAGADVVEVPAEPRLLGPAASSAEVPIAARVTSVDAARAARTAGAGLLLVPTDHLAAAEADTSDNARENRSTDPHAPGSGVAVLVSHARDVPTAPTATTGAPVALDTVGLVGVDSVAETSLALAVGARLIRTSDVRRSRRVVEVMAALLEARS